ncbi:MAG: hypothetical protein K0S32_3881 [Bacteroidetes bacterium]|jgi:hypothetical protein|nr:hypothetical protein [Bacteroidota bacterium]
MENVTTTPTLCSLLTPRFLREREPTTYTKQQSPLRRW